MIYPGSVMFVSDNSGAKKIRCIKVLGGTRTGRASIGDTIVASVRSMQRNQSNDNLKKGKVVKAIIVRTRAPLVRDTGVTLRFRRNDAVIVNDQNQPVGNRVFGPVPQELRDNNLIKILSIAEEVV